MNAAPCTEYDDIQVLVATSFAYGCVETARVSLVLKCRPRTMRFTRLLRRLEPPPEALWREVAPHADRSGGVLAVDDSTLEEQSGPARRDPLPIHVLPKAAPFSSVHQR
jgi:hypothetical protein